MTLTRRQILASAASLAAVAAMPAASAIAAVVEAPVVARVGWTPITASVVKNGMLVVRMTDWFGGTGPKPPVGYIGENGIVLDPAEAVHFFQIAEQA
jgi:hypothetical protein